MRSVSTKRRKKPYSMRKVPYVFQSRNELLDHLQSRTTRARAEEYFSERLPDIVSVVRRSIAGNTFRAFQKLPERPSVVFRNWASDRLHRTFEEIKGITDRESYAAYIHESALDFCEVWSGKMNAEIGYGRSTKLLNLVLKRLACLEGIDDTTRRKIIKFQHVPLDSYTIVGLRKLITDPEIPRNATMRFIQQPSEYRKVQQYISGVATEANVPAIYYDILAWNMAH
jgi:hypothetical protein